MELWLLIGGTILVMAASLLLGEYLQKRREQGGAQRKTDGRVASCVRFASKCTGQMVWAGALESAKRKTATEVLAKMIYENNYEMPDRAIEWKICTAVNELL